MKYQVIYRTDGMAEIHSNRCNEIDWKAYPHHDRVDAANPYGAAVEAWSHEDQAAPDEFACTMTLLMECLAPRTDEVEIPDVPLRATLDTKVDILLSWAVEHGWAVTDQGQSFEFARDDEFIVCVFEGNRWDGAASAWTMESRSLRLPSQADALRRLAGRPEDVTERERKAREKRPTKRSVPFDDNDEDETILVMVKGHEIVWVNSFSGDEEIGVVPPDGTFSDGKREYTYNNHLALSVSSTGRRVLTFVDYLGTGFRSVALDAIVAVK